jgi:hypothetical protein
VNRKTPCAAAVVVGLYPARAELAARVTWAILLQHVSRKIENPSRLKEADVRPNGANGKAHSVAKSCANACLRIVAHNFLLVAPRLAPQLLLE